jgi:hypothetical protein
VQANPQLPEDESSSGEVNEKKAPRKSLRKCINDFCKRCLYDQVGGNGTWRQQIDNCTAHDCPLYPVRPRSRTAEDDEDEE